MTQHSTESSNESKRCPKCGQELPSRWMLHSGIVRQSLHKVMDRCDGYTDGSVITGMADTQPIPRMEADNE